MKNHQQVFKKKKNKRITAFLLALTVLFTAFPFVHTPSVAAETVMEEESSTEKVVLDSQEKELSYVELPDLREPYIKHFQREDGMRVAVVYPEAVHTIVNGKMENIDNRLVYNAKAAAYQSLNPNFSVAFAESAAEEDAVSIHFDGHTISWRVDVLRNANTQGTWQDAVSTKETALTATATEKASLAAKATLTQSEFLLAEDGKTYTKSQLSNSFTSVVGLQYKNAFQQSAVDLRYSISENRIEEDIILNNRNDIRSYIMQITAEGLTASKLPDDSIVFCDEHGQTVFTIGAPWMSDAAGEFSCDITVSLLQKGSSVSVVYTPDAAWLNDADRIYPVLIDPSVKTRNYTANYLDTYINSNNTYHARMSQLQTTMTGVNAAGTMYYETYTYFVNLPKITSDMDIQGVTMRYYSSTVGLLPHLLRFWIGDKSIAYDIETLLYDTRPLGSGGSYSPTVSQVATGVYANSYDLTAGLRAFGNTYGSVENFLENYFMGFRMYRDPNTTSTSTTKGYFSAEYPTASYRPCLEIEYEYTPVYPVASGGVYSIENVNSSKRITVPSASTNAFQMQAINYNNQAFRLVGEDGIYTIQPISRTNEALTWDYTDGSAPQTATNLYSAALTSANADKQEFLLHYEGDNDLGYPCFSILSRADTRMALTAYGTATGSATGTSTTSNGNVYIDEYTGGASQLWCFYSGGMPCLIGNDIVEGNGTTMAYDYGVHATNIQPFAYVTAFGETISWESSNNGIVSFDTEGFAYISGIGTAVLTARIKNSAGTLLRSYAYTVCIAMDNDVYYIKNAKTGGYLGLPNVELTNGIDVEMQSKITSGDGMYYQLWKVYHIGDGRYSIRPIKALSKGLNKVGDGVTIYNINLNDTRAGVSDAREWAIVCAEFGEYRILNQNSYNNALYATETQLGIAYAAYATDDIKPAGQAWVFEKADYNQDALFLTEVSEVAIGKPETASVIFPALAIQNQTPSWSSSNTNVVTVNSAGQLTGISRGNAQITATNGDFSGSFSLKVIRKAIIIVPGLMGSKLISGETSGSIIQGDDLWSTAVTSSITGNDISQALLTMEKLTFLGCDDEGNSIHNVQVASDVDSRHGDDAKFGVMNRYENLYRELSSSFSEEYDVRFFNYDWRLSNEISANKLNEFIVNNQYEKVIFVTHSMGGLVVSKYLTFGETERNRIEKNIMIAPPLLGTPIVVYILGSGDIDPIVDLDDLSSAMLYLYNELIVYILSNLDDVRGIMNNMKSLYELIPSEQYFTYDDEINASETYAEDWYLTTSILGSLPYNIKTYDRTMERLNGIVGFNTSHLSHAQMFHESLYDPHHIALSVPSYFLIGYGKETSMRFEFDNANWICTNSYLLGDTLVPIHSASLGESNPNSTFYQETDHTSITSTQATLNFVSSVIRNETIEDSESLKCSYPATE